MLIIRKEQIDLLSRNMAGHFAGRLARQWRASHPETTKGRNDASLLSDTEQAIRTAEAHGISARADLERFVGFVMEYGTSFGFTPDTQWAGAILQHPSIPGSDKMAKI